MQLSVESLSKLDTSKNRILIDWFSFSSRIDSFETLASLIGMSSVNWQERCGVRGYSSRFVFEGVTIHYAGYNGLRFGGTAQEQDVKGAWLEMSGQGCRTFETYGNGDWQKLIDYCVYNKKNITVNRVDLAYDDFLGFLDIDKIFEDALNLNFVSKCRHVFTTTSIDTTTKELGKTICHGKESSDIYIRIYDKRIEQHAQVYLDHWVRNEIMIRHDRAAAVLDLLSDDVEYKDGKRVVINSNTPLNEVYFLLMNNYLRYIEPSDTDSNRWRSPMAEHWKKFSQSVTTYRISLFSSPGVDYNVSKLQSYVCDTAGAAILTFVKIFGVDKLLDFIDLKFPFLAPKYQLLLQQLDEGTLFDTSVPEDLLNDVRT